MPVHTDAIEAMGGAPPPGYSSGGMRTKLAAARIATGAGCAMAIALGGIRNPLASLEAGARCTWFASAVDGRSARKRWIAGSLLPAGTLTIDAGAARARPAGEGGFERGDPVLVRDEAGAPLAKGLSAYGSEDARRIAGRRSDEIEAVLGWRGRDEVIHRDDLVLL